MGIQFSALLLQHSSHALPPTSSSLPHAGDGTVQTVLHAWNDFLFLDAGIVFCQQGSSKLLFSQLPPLDDEQGSGVFLFGSHTGERGCTHDVAADFPRSRSIYLNIRYSPLQNNAKTPPPPAGEVLCLARSSKHLVSGSADGSIKLWGAEDGQLVDMKAEPSSGTRITAVHFVGPFLVGGGLGVRQREGVILPHHRVCRSSYL